MSTASWIFLSFSAVESFVPPSSISSLGNKEISLSSLNNSDIKRTNIIVNTKDEIISAGDVAYNNDEFYGKELEANNDVYQKFSFTLKKGDNRFLIYQLKGLIFLSYEECTKKKKNVKFG